jgi:predicted AlkP superfamily pyrophosphatase or phosphodiesterase
VEGWELTKVIEIVLDGLRYDTLRSSMGYVNHLIEQSQAAVYRVRAELPSLSRPLYEVLLTGTPSSVNGIVSNLTVRLSHQQSLFHLARAQGLRTAAAAYYWVSELYQRAPFDYVADRFQDDEARPIQHGIFYFEDSYPDSHLFIDAEHLRSTWNPDYLLVHSMNIDDIGHKHSGDSAEYRGQALRVDTILSMVLPAWTALGYTVLITADHGMNSDGQHGGTSQAEREVPLVAIGPAFEPGDYTAEELPQLELAPLVCRLLGIQPSPAMQSGSVPGLRLS